MTPSVRPAFAAAVRVAADLTRHPEVERRWSDESACAGMTVGALARHLVSQWFNAVRLLRAPDGTEPITVWQHYERAAWVHTTLDDDANVSIMAGSEALAAEGAKAMHRLVDELGPELEAVLAADRTAPVLIPWQGWSLTVDDFLLTRMMEVVVHSDDLAASLEVETPTFPPEVVTPVVALLSEIAVRRHGATGVVRALSRPQRAPASIAAF